jgi:hypothetical protein
MTAKTKTTAISTPTTTPATLADRAPTLRSGRTVVVVDVVDVVEVDVAVVTVLLVLHVPVVAVVVDVNVLLVTVVTVSVVVEVNVAVVVVVVWSSQSAPWYPKSHLHANSATPSSQMPWPEQVWPMQSSMLWLQSAPANPVLHTHLYEPRSLTHVPPLQLTRLGTAHSSMSDAHVVPVYPVLQMHLNFMSSWGASMQMPLLKQSWLSQ